MTATRTRKPAEPEPVQTSPEPEPVQVAEPEPVQEPEPEPVAAEPEQESAPLDIIGAAETEQVSKSARVYVDVTPRVLTPSGSLACVQREQRADGTLGEYLLASITIGKGSDGKPRENARQTPIALLQECKDALGSAGVHILRGPLGIKL